MYQVWEGDLFLFTVDFEEEADMYSEQGYTIVNQSK
jgi:hypothetical protein